MIKLTNQFLHQILIYLLNRAERQIKREIQQIQAKIDYLDDLDKKEKADLN